MIGDNIKTIRKNRDMSQKELAEAVNVRPQTVSSWEVNRTEPSMGAIEALAAALNCRKSDLIGEQNPLANYYPLTDEEKKIILAYRAKDRATKGVICKILDIKKDPSESLTEAG